MIFRNSKPYKRNKFYEDVHPKPPKKNKLHKEKNFGTYCGELMKQSLITGFPVIAQSKNSVRRSVKLFVFLICTAGFFYQTYSFLELYLAYPTMLDISVEHPESFNAPAITVCNRNRLWRQRFCKVFHDECIWNYANWETFCTVFKMQCPKYKPEGFSFGTPDTRQLMTPNRSNEVLYAVGPQNESDLIFGCTIKEVASSVPKMGCNSSVMIQAAKEGLPYRCFSLMSLLGKPNKESVKVSLTDEYSIILSMRPEDNMYSQDLVQAYVFIHDARILANPMAEGVTLSAGKQYKIYVTMERRESLPLPYASKCMDYLSEWKKNGGHGPLSKKGCTDLCKINLMVEKYGCVGQTITYPNDYQICNNASIITSPEMNKQCSENCRDACEENIYYTTTEITGDLSLACGAEAEEHCKNEYIGILVSFSRMTIEKYKQGPKFQSVELFSYIGGYMGMWLGISLVSLFDFIEMLYDVLTYPVLRKKNRKTTHLEEFKRRMLHE